jgi:hypothetical protein
MALLLIHFMDSGVPPVDVAMLDTDDSEWKVVRNRERMRKVVRNREQMRKN